MVVFGGSTKVLLACTLVFLGAGQLEVLAELWYWVFQSQMRIRKEVKELELRVAELSSER